MKRARLLFVAILISFRCLAQVSLDSGYYIDNNGSRTDGLIENVDWRNNPTTFKFSLSAEEGLQKLSIREVREFGVTGGAKYVRDNVQIDRSSDVVEHMSHDSDPEFKEEQLFLKVLVEGKTTLLGFRSGNLKRYFFKRDTLPAQQLIYKRYLTQDGDIRKNMHYKGQLLAALQCPAVTRAQISKARYSLEPLSAIFVAYNQFYVPEDSETASLYVSKQTKGAVNLSVKAGFNHSSLTLEDVASDLRDADFGTNGNMKVAVEMEYVLPYNRNKWAILVEPAYRSFEGEEVVVNGMRWVKADYESIELSVGLRHYFFLNDQSKFFLNGFVVWDFDNGGMIDFESAYDLDFKSKMSLSLGVGYAFNNRFSAEVRYAFERDVLRKYEMWNAYYKSVSLMFGYRIF